MTSKRLCWWMVIGSVVGFVVLAAWLVPWHWVPGGHIVHVDADQVFSRKQIEKAQDVSSTRRWVGWSSYAVSMVVSLALGLTRLGRQILGRLPGPWWVQVPIATAVVLVIGTLATLPFAWVSHRLAVEHGLSTQDTGAWLGDVALSLLVGWVFTAVGLLVLFAIWRRSPRRWPLWAGLSAAALAVLGSFVYPVVVEPLFNDFTPMRDGAMKTSIVQLADREHVQVSEVLIADASRRTTSLNAYVSGFGSTRRVVVYDNLLRDLPPDEVRSVIAHELGHAHHHDVLLGTGLAAIGSFLGVGLLGLLLPSAWLRRRAGLRSAGDPVAVAAVLALVAVGTFAASPVENVISRALEARADRSALQATDDPTSFVRLQKELALSSLIDPDPPRWSQFWWGSHPTTLQRIGLAEALDTR